MRAQIVKAFAIQARIVVFSVTFVLCAPAFAGKRCHTALAGGVEAALSRALQVDPSLKPRAREILRKGLKDRGYTEYDIQLMIHMAIHSGLLMKADIREIVTGSMYMNKRPNYFLKDKDFEKSPEFAENIVPEVPASEMDPENVLHAPLRWRVAEDGKIQILSNRRVSDWAATERNLKLHARQEKVQSLNNFPSVDLRDYASARLLGDETSEQKALSDLFATRSYSTLMEAAATFQDQKLFYQIMVSAFLSWQLPGRHQHFHNYLHYAIEGLARLTGAHRERAIELLAEMLPEVVERSNLQPDDYPNLFSLLVSAGKIEKRFAVDSARQGLITRIENPELLALAKAVLARYDREILPKREYQPPGSYDLLKYAVGATNSLEDLGVKAIWALGQMAPVESLRGGAGRPDQALARIEQARERVRNAKKTSSEDWLRRASAEEKRDFGINAFEALISADEALRFSK